MLVGIQGKGDITRNRVSRTLSWGTYAGWAAQSVPSVPAVERQQPWGATSGAFPRPDQAQQSLQAQAALGRAQGEDPRGAGRPQAQAPRRGAQAVRTFTPA